jgi:hypothetical protein
MSLLTLPLVLLLAALSMAPAAATAVVPVPSVDKPSGRVLLTITGSIQRSNGDKGAEFDRDMLEEIGMVELRTESPFIAGPTVFRGVRLRDLLRFVGAEGTRIAAVALDLYTAEIPIADVEEHDVILAMEANGRTLRVRDRGPTWIMYPFSDNPSLDNEVFHARCVWQLVSLDVR